MSFAKITIAAALTFTVATAIMPAQDVFAQGVTSSTSTVAPVTVPVNTIVRGEAGKAYELEKVDVQSGQYKVTVTSENQSSVHPDSDIIVRSQNSEVTVHDVESKEFVEKTADGTLEVTDGKVTVLVQLGKDKVFSGGVTVTLTYVPEEPKDVEVCDPETGEVITVTEDKQNHYLPADDPACEGVGEEVPETLPEAGPATALLLAGLAGGGGAVAHNRILRTKRK